MGGQRLRNIHWDKFLEGSTSHCHSELKQSIERLRKTGVHYLVSPYFGGAGALLRLTIADD